MEISQLASFLIVSTSRITFFYDREQTPISSAFNFPSCAKDERSSTSACSLASPPPILFLVRNLNSPREGHYVNIFSHKTYDFRQSRASPCCSLVGTLLLASGICKRWKDRDGADILLQLEVIAALACGHAERVVRHKASESVGKTRKGHALSELQ